MRMDGVRFGQLYVSYFPQLPQSGNDDGNVETPHVFILPEKSIPSNTQPGGVYAMGYWPKAALPDDQLDLTHKPPKVPDKPQRPIFMTLLANSPTARALAKTLSNPNHVFSTDWFSGLLDTKEQLVQDVLAEADNTHPLHAQARADLVSGLDNGYPVLSVHLKTGHEGIILKNPLKDELLASNPDEVPVTILEPKNRRKIQTLEIVWDRTLVEKS